MLIKQSKTISIWIKYPIKPIKDNAISNHSFKIIIGVKHKIIKVNIKVLKSLFGIISNNQINYLLINSIYSQISQISSNNNSNQMQTQVPSQIKTCNFKISFLQTINKTPKITNKMEEVKTVTIENSGIFPVNKIRVTNRILSKHLFKV